MLDRYKTYAQSIIKISEEGNPNQLRTYCETLDFETIKVLQTIMYLGRDRDYDYNDTPEEIYKKQREYFDLQGWNTQEIETNQMIGKKPLPQYLREGFEILKISLIEG